ncbi:MAG TPA: hypothetical protein DIU00_00190, partial [Phycisphaerales bacterium]|nr:hypothetical protein [Phycisphaerales bacterium]
MNAILERINSAGYAFVEFALPMLVQSCVLILILLVADLLLRKKVRAVFRYWIWMLVLLKLILPTSLSSPFSLGSWLGDELASVEMAATIPRTEAEGLVKAPVNVPPVIAPVNNERVDLYTERIEPALAVMPETETKMAEPSETPAVRPLPPNPPVPLSWQAIVFLLWLAVVLVMGLLLLQRAFFVRGLVIRAGQADGPMTDAFISCRKLMGIKRKVGLKVSANATSPAVCGLFRPVILVPQNLERDLSSSQLQAVLLHELAHIRRGDLWVNLAQTLLQIFYVYNPLLWLANAIIRRIREQAVDEMVLVAMGRKAQQYPQTLVQVAKMAFNRPAPGLRMIGVVESQSALAGRIKHIL